MTPVTTKFNSLLQDLKEKRLKYLLNQTFSKLPAKFQEKILKQNTYTRESPEDHSASTWQLGDDVRVVDVTFEDGMLVVSLEKIIPDHMRRTTYEVK